GRTAARAAPRPSPPRSPTHPAPPASARNPAPHRAGTFPCRPAAANETPTQRCSIDPARPLPHSSAASHQRHDLHPVAIGQPRIEKLRPPHELLIDLHGHAQRFELELRQKLADRQRSFEPFAPAIYVNFH